MSGKPKSSARLVVIGVCVHPDELKVIQSVAALQDRTVSSLLRREAVQPWLRLAAQSVLERGEQALEGRAVAPLPEPQKVA
jgi:hypothetical protein